MRKCLCKFNGVAVMRKLGESVMELTGAQAGLVRLYFASESSKPGAWWMGNESAPGLKVLGGIRLTVADFGDQSRGREPDAGVWDECAFARNVFGARSTVRH